ncbi:hypothetical protein ASPVEDRAFT_891109 [Aspergillus versicolor CBS 583.65]|uniref:Linalool dehydratase/isomerase domain-containing protein n=1 Tax=Aspergillus versicolor CBS 583.65 TaxID=1036611 RepID=A0A1L9PQV5_ASPVE|nr:uncharacterized protein ASPVEDRAFT_891109 [Aspergillus versicolor CBS 583.65]OJJ03914.1 hypothetical protein ASPVEDRAFT_891109 [Aspergillus versicolor CBS 583.65]
MTQNEGKSCNRSQRQLMKLKYSKGPQPVPSGLLIPVFTGAQKVTSSYQRRTQLQYAFLIALAVTGFYKFEDPQIRVAGLSCAFPGAGFLAVGGIWGAFGVIISVALIPLSLFAWFGAGGLAFVLANWIIPGLVATAVTGDGLWEPAAPIVFTFVAGVAAYGIIAGRSRHYKALGMRESRNGLLLDAESKWSARVQSLPDPDEKRELSIEELRMLQHFVEVAHQAPDDWSNFTVIDQFQTSALRYQLYFLQYTLAVVQKYYMPSFQGYIKTGQERLIERSTTKDVMNYWKWESLWGKFTFDWDPVVRDNIMVTGYIVLCLSLYEKLNGDDRYRQPNALNFRITDKANYHHTTESIFDALMKNWESCSYCLFPCEPNWIYSSCNLIGMEGALAYDSYMKTGRAAKLLHNRFQQGLQEDFMNPDGSIVALRSAISVLGDVSGAFDCSPGMPEVGRRLWLLSKESNIQKAKTGKYYLENLDQGPRQIDNKYLVGADKMDVGNYQAGPGFAHCAYSNCATEFGESDIAHDLIAEVDEKLHPLVETSAKSGALTNRGLSLLATTFLFRARIGRRKDWANLLTGPVDEQVRAAPKLDSVPFPEVMVARCHPVRGPEGIRVEFLLRGPKKPKNITIAFTDLQEGVAYHLAALNNNQWEEGVTGIKADGNGRAYMQIVVGDRSEFVLRT